MRLLLENKFFRYSSLSSFFNQFGSSIYNIVFVIYVANTYQSKILLGIANITLAIPLLFQLWIGQKADDVEDRATCLIRIGLLQALLFLTIAWLTKEATYFSFSFICLFNIISDCLSQLHSGTLMPIFKHHIPSKKLMEAYSFRNVLSYTCSLGGQTFGIWLLSVSNNNFSLTAFFNAISFLLSTAILLSIKNLLLPKKSNSTKDNFWLRIQTMYKTSKQIFSSDSNDKFLKIISAIVVTNILGSAITPIYSIYFLENSFLNLSYSQSLFVLQSIVIIGNILGSLSPKDYFAQLSLTTLIQLQVLGYIIIAICELLKIDFLLILIILAFNCYLVGKFNPKFSSLLMENVPEGQLAQVSSFVSLIVTISIPLGTGIFSFLSSYKLSYAFCSYILFGIFALRNTIQSSTTG